MEAERVYYEKRILRRPIAHEVHLWGMASCVIVSGDFYG
jgi:hypothetical protein